jgi:hypothetical protein
MPVSPLASYCQQPLQMMAASADQASPVMKLCADTLATVSSPPGRIYDKHALTISPSDELTDVLKSMSEAIKKMTGSAPS